MSLFHKNFTSITELSCSQIEELLNRAAVFETGQDNLFNQILEGQILALIFFTASTRTQLSFQTAVLRLGGQPIFFSDSNPVPGRRRPVEALRDLARVIDSYADAVVLRHPYAESVREFTEFSRIPIISGGTGVCVGAEHPTQTLVDLYTLRKAHDRIGHLRVLIMGELDGRASRSLIAALSLFPGNVIYLLYPDENPPVKADLEIAQMRGVKITRVYCIRSVISDVDAIYHNGIDSRSSYDQIYYRLNTKIIESLPERSVVMHPLPRHKNELSFDVDGHPSARYFEQSAAGVPVRMAVLEAILQCK